MGLKHLTIKEMKELAAKCGGKCLSKQYFNSNTKLKWQCANRHIWEATPHGIKAGHWCAICVKKRNGLAQRLTIEEMQKLAGSKGGKCLSKQYINARIKLKWQCANGHTWEAIPSSVKAGHWCAICVKKRNGLAQRLTIEEMQKLAGSKGGKCLSKEYVNNNTKLKWQCADGHIWETIPSNIKIGHWCPTCAGQKPLTIEEMQKIAFSRGGRCLSKQCINAHTKLKWQCANGHIWEAIPDGVKRGGWCPICSPGTGERITKKIFEYIFRKRFTKVKPDWLLNLQGNKMEIDGYCDKLKLGFEYQGRQHYEDISYFSGHNLEKRMSDDRLKKKLCKKHGIILIEVPFSLEYSHLYNFIISQCKKNDIIIPNVKKINIADLEIFHPQDLKEMQKLASSRGGKCLSKQYLGNDNKLEWQCKNKHVWKATPHSIKGGRWCPTCAGQKPLTIEEMQKIASSRGGKCLSKQYINTDTKLKWQCKNGHTWKARPYNIKTGNWCPICAGKKPLTIEEMQKIASSRGGKCLSKQYINTDTKLKWQCKNKHVWEATPTNVKRGTWCPYCARDKKK